MSLVADAAAAVAASGFTPSAVSLGTWGGGGERERGREKKTSFQMNLVSLFSGCSYSAGALVVQVRKYVRVTPDQQVKTQRVQY